MSTADAGRRDASMDAPADASTQRPMMEFRRTGWDIALGVLSVIAGIVALGHVVLASLVSVLFLGWMALIGGVMIAVSVIARWRSGAQRANLLAGVLLAIIGFGFIRNPEAGLLVLTLLAGSLLLVGGIVRIASAFEPQTPTAMFAISGVITLLLGVLVLFRWPVSALWFLGTVLGVQLIIDGVTTALTGRLRPVEPAEGVATARARTRRPEATGT